MKLRKGGLKPTPPDDRDFTLGAITTLPPLSELPESFILPGVTIKNQCRTDFCTQFMACGMSELQENVSLCPEWAFAVSKMLSGDVDGYGEDIRTALSVHTKHGAVEATECPYSVETHDSDFLRRIKNYSAELFNFAVEHLKKSYVKVTGPYDHFDNIKATIWKYRDQKRSVGSGFVFGWDSDDKYFKTIPKKGGGHAMHYVGWKGDYLVVANSYGTRAGENGFHYVSRKVVNHFVDMYGAYMFLDMDPETIKYMIDNGIRDRDNWLIQLYKSLVMLLTAQLEVLKKNVT